MDKRTRSDHFLWKQQRLRESSDSKHAAKIQNDRERFYNQRDAAPRKRQKSNQEIEASADFAMSLGPLIWILFKWFLAYLLWHFVTALAGGIGSGLGIFVTVVFIGLTVLKQVRRRRKRRGY